MFTTKSIFVYVFYSFCYLKLLKVRYQQCSRINAKCDPSINCMESFIKTNTILKSQTQIMLVSFLKSCHICHSCWLIRLVSFLFTKLPIHGLSYAFSVDFNTIFFSHSDLNCLFFTIHVTKIRNYTP